MSDVAVVFDRVSKKFRRGELHDSLRDLIPAIAQRLVRGAHPEELHGKEFWALRDVEFEVKRGEAFGIVGHNGAGKSTILKLLCGIMNPTLGTLHVRGRRSGLLEIGAGFHPDLTGRENIYLNGVILGMSRREIASKFDEIVDFSGVGEFIDTPVKRYSSGMFARLGFSVAAHLEPDILIVDEVLSVGDFQFQKKSLEKMNALATGGATVLFVSHNLKAVAELCQRCAVLDHGVVREIGPSHEVLHGYLSQNRVDHEGVQSDVRISALSVRGADGPRHTFQSGERVSVVVEVTASQAARGLSVGISLLDESFYNLFWVTTERLGQPTFSLAPGQTARVSFDLVLHLGKGTYHLGAEVLRRDVMKIYDRWPHAASIFVSSSRDTLGVVDLEPSVDMQGGTIP